MSRHRSSDRIAQEGFKVADCTDGDTLLCIQQERFEVQVEWRDFEVAGVKSETLYKFQFAYGF